MFQYAYAKALEHKGYDVKIDISGFENYKLHGGYQLDLFNIDLKLSTNEENDRYIKRSVLLKFSSKLGFNFSKKIKEKSLLFDKNLMSLKMDHYVEGYFQCEKYFKEIRNVLLKQFTLKNDLSNYSKSILKLIKTSKNTCSIHVRRGDFINETNRNIHGICKKEYYERAIEEIQKINIKTKYFVFSDDINWCKENLKFKDIIFVSNPHVSIPHEDILLMSLCHHNIISNSTFGWWGAWLNQNENSKVIAPKRWFVDDELEKQSKFIVCESWLRK